ncbi:MAG: YggS family pyridoxal phosphate-dependent enzyme, partial [Paraglaciecola chathamensis]
MISFIFQHNFTQSMSDIAQRYQQVQTQLTASAHAHGRHTQDIQLLAVSKTQPPECILEAYHLGQRAFGENYLQEAREKQQALSDYEIEWHFIGPIQSNKTRDIAENFAWVHSVDRLKIATRLNDQRPEHLPPLNICIQLNIDNESSKSGATLEQLPELAHEINALPRLRLRGLMVIPEKRDDESQ